MRIDLSDPSDKSDNTKKPSPQKDSASLIFNNSLASGILSLASFTSLLSERNLRISALKLEAQDCAILCHIHILNL